MKKGFGVVTKTKYAQILNYITIKNQNLFVQTGRLNSNNPILLKRSVEETLNFLNITNPEVVGYISINLNVLTPRILIAALNEDYRNFHRAIIKKFNNADFSCCFEVDKTLDVDLINLIVQSIMIFLEEHQ